MIQVLGQEEQLGCRISVCTSGGLCILTDSKTIVPPWLCSKWNVEASLLLATGEISILYDIEKAIKYEESPMRTLMKLANEMPEFSKKLNEYLEVAKNANSKK